jgi:hypothetical protein
VKRFLEKLFAARRPVVPIAVRDADPPDLTAATVALFREHSIKSREDGGAVDLPDHGCRVMPIVVSETIYETGCTCQLDVRLELSDGTVVIESFAGIDHDAAKARLDGFENFVRSSFHVLLRAVLLPAPDDQVDVEEWVIGEQRFVVTIGCVTARRPAPDWPVPTQWFETFEAAIKRTVAATALLDPLLLRAHERRELGRGGSLEQRALAGNRGNHGEGTVGGVGGFLQFEAFPDAPSSGLTIASMRCSDPGN